MQAKLVCYNKEIRGHPTYVMRVDLRELTRARFGKREWCSTCGIYLWMRLRDQAIFCIFINVIQKTGSIFFCKQRQDEEESARWNVGIV